MSNIKKTKKPSLEAIKQAITSKPRPNWEKLNVSPFGESPSTSKLEESLEEDDDLDDENLDDTYEDDSLAPAVAAPPPSADHFFSPKAKKLSHKSMPRAQILSAKKPELIDNIDLSTTVAEEIPTANNNDVEIIRQSMVIERMPERMRIIAVATDQEGDFNEINLISCNGDPLGCYAYNAQHDGYYINCKAHVDLGSIPVAYRIKSQGMADCNNIIALPDELIENYFSPVQKKTVKSFREKYASPRFVIQYMQAITS